MLWLSEHKKLAKGSSFRIDHMCLLALAAHLSTKVSENLKPLLFYRQESVSHIRWITAASGYLRMPIFGHCVTSQNVPKLWRIMSFIVSVYLPAFLAIHFKPSAAEGPSVVLFTRDLLLAYKAVDEPVFVAVWKHFVHRVSQWLYSKNVALSVHAEVHPFTADAVKQKSFPKCVDIEQKLLTRGTLRDFFTKDSKMAPCISCLSSTPGFWRSIDNNN